MARFGPHSEETKRKIGLANKGVWVKYDCDYCKKECEEKISAYKLTKRHFCNMKCYGLYKSHIMKPEEQGAYKGGGMSKEKKAHRIKARNVIGHGIRDGKITREPCEVCGEKKTEAHHHDYDKPLDVKWLCRKCHLDEHKIMFGKTDY